MGLPGPDWNMLATALGAGVTDFAVILCGLPGERRGERIGCPVGCPVGCPGVSGCVRVGRPMHQNLHRDLCLNLCGLSGG